jgi:leucine dehydrogenase
MQGIKACALEVFGDPDLTGRTIAIQGVGKVGYALCGYLVKEGAKVTVAEIHKLEVDIFAPCALGSLINDDTISEFRCKVIAGAANNQLATDEHGDKLRDLGILYAPDFVINSGGLINVEDELRGYERDRAMARVEGIYRQLQHSFTMSRERDLSTARAAMEYAEDRIRKIGRIRLVRTSEFGPTSAH